ncbi:IclR family transcriptional regulator [Streptomyces sp. NPDC007896]|uniref:IclR family transcriptional regulator n=1 Tax=Streptomyces sp. NPDC007896 TaxID=3364784 RepID=UPI0036E556A6
MCEQLADQVAETINLAILDRDAAITVDQVLGPSAIITHNWPGRRTPLHATSSGKTLLTHLPEPELESRLAAPLESCTPPVTDPGTLRAQLEHTRTDGCAHSVEALERGLNAVAAPVFSLNGQVVAALSASGPSFLLTEQRLPEASALVQAAAEKISDRLGHPRRA